MSPVKQSLLLLLHLGVLLLLTGCCEGQSQMIGPTKPVVAMIGDDIILPCHLEPAVDAVELTVEWSRQDLKPRFVYVRRNGVELLTEQNSLYTKRTSLSLSKLKYGDISLKLSSVQLSDAGTYKCHVPTFGAESEMELIVGSVSSPVIELSKEENKMVLECKSNGWYPEPRLLWLNSEGKLISAEPTKTVRGSDDLYAVSSKVSVEKGHSYSFTCRVQQKNISQIKEAQIHVSDDLFMFQSNTAVRITVNLVVCLIAVGAVTSILFIIWKREQKKTETTRHNEDEREIWMEEQSLREGKEKEELDEELQNHKEHLQHVSQIITKLTDQKKDLKTQRDKLSSLLQEDKAEMKEVEKKLAENPKLDKDKKNKKRKNWLEDLTMRKNEHEELLKITDKLMETTEDIIIQMTERKAKLEKEKEKIRKHLKEKQKNKQAEVKNPLKEEKKEEGNNEPVSVETQ